jgi:hypothetical protein
MEVQGFNTTKNIPGTQSHQDAHCRSAGKLHWLHIEDFRYTWPTPVFPTHTNPAVNFFQIHKIRMCQSQIGTRKLISASLFQQLRQERAYIISPGNDDGM